MGENLSFRKRTKYKGRHQATAPGSFTNNTIKTSPTILRHHLPGGIMYEVYANPASPTSKSRLLLDNIGALEHPLTNRTCQNRLDRERND